MRASQGRYHWDVLLLQAFYKHSPLSSNHNMWKGRGIHRYLSLKNQRSLRKIKKASRGPYQYIFSNFVNLSHETVPLRCQLWLRQQWWQQGDNYTGSAEGFCSIFIVSLGQNANCIFISSLWYRRLDESTNISYRACSTGGWFDPPYRRLKQNYINLLFYF